MDELDHLGWVVHRSYEIGGVQFGIRTNSEGGARWLDETFGEYRVDEDTNPYYSLLVGNGDGRPGKRFHILYEESRALVRSQDLALVGAALLAQFDQLQARERTDCVFVEAGIVRFGGAIGLVPPILPPFLRTLGHRVLERSGLELAVRMHVALTEDGKVTMEPSTLHVPVDALERLAEIAPTNGTGNIGPPPAEPDLVCLIGLADEPVKAVSKGHAAHVLATRVINLEAAGRRGLEAVARLVERTRCCEIRATTPKGSLETLVQALQQA